MATYLYKVIRRVRRIAGHHNPLVEVPERGVGVIASRGQDNRPLLVHRLVAGHWVAWVSLVPVAGARERAVRARAIVHGVQGPFGRVSALENESVCAASKVERDERVGQRLVAWVELGLLAATLQATRCRQGAKDAQTRSLLLRT